MTHANSARALMRTIIDAPETKPRFKAQAEGILELLIIGGIDDMADAVLLLMGMLAGTEDRLDKTEARHGD